jgi:hypothetical protein
MAESAHKPTVHVDAGAEGRVMVADSLRFFEHEPWTKGLGMAESTGHRRSVRPRQPRRRPLPVAGRNFRLV